jgi:UDP-N-acetylmuramate dehydrogenase
MVLNLQKNRSLSEFSTFGIGGPIDYFAAIETVAEMEEAFRFCREEKLPFLIVGKGSNCLFSDKGFSGVVLQNKISFCNWMDKTVEVGAGYPFSLLGSQSARKQLTGLEFASGIPATVGGAIFMNAGANGGQTFDSLGSVFYLHFEGRIMEYKKEELAFDYRFSSFQKMKGAILSAVFQLASFEQAREKQLQIIDYRLKTQPLKDKSIGCIFRNPAKGISAGAIIEQCGLKGLSVGEAKVSEIHANFIVNKGRATAQDVQELIQIIQEAAQKQTGLHLEVEIKVIDEIY